MATQIRKGKDLDQDIAFKVQILSKRVKTTQRSLKVDTTLKLVPRLSALQPIQNMPFPRGLF